MVAFHVTVAGTSWLAALRSWIVVPLTVAGASASLKVAVTFAPMGNPEAPLDGAVTTTVGGVVSGPGGLTL